MNDTTTLTHREIVCKDLSPMGKRLFRFIEFDDEEEMLAEIHKHPIGLVFILLTGLFIAVIVSLITILASRATTNVNLEFTDNTTVLNTIIIVTGLIFIIFVLLATTINGILYHSSSVFITNQKLAEVTYVSLLNRRIVQLGIGNVEDVTIVQKGVLPHLFKYGSLLVETAGETKNPDFTYVPNPHYYSQIIIQAHENYVQKYGN